MTLSRSLLLGSLLLAALPANAQNYAYAPAPLYPYAVPGQNYGYTTQAPQYVPRAYPAVRARASRAHASAKIMEVDAVEREAPVTRPGRARVGKVDPALVEELRARGRKDHKDSKEKYVDGKKIDKTIVVRGKPRVVTTERIVDDPPIVVTRNHVVDVPEEAPAGRGLLRGGRNRARAQIPEQAVPPGNDAPRLIRAEAEVHILGPDRMSIKLFRRGTRAPIDLAND